MERVGLMWSVGTWEDQDLRTAWSAGAEAKRVARARAMLDFTSSVGKGFKQRISLGDWHLKILL